METYEPENGWVWARAKDPPADAVVQFHDGEGYAHILIKRAPLPANVQLIDPLQPAPDVEVAVLAWLAEPLRRPR